MGDIKGFLKTKRQGSQYRPVCQRLKDFQEVGILRSHIDSEEQASRCMDCGVPFCHWACPLGNFIPEWNDLVFTKQWKKAYELLMSTNNFPEFTGKLCPAPCEYSCVLGINDDPVTIRENELAIVEYAFKHGFAKPSPPKKRTGKKVSIVGSGPAGLACCDQLNKAGHTVTLFERDERIGGILRYGIPDFKLDKKVIDRRLDILKKEGIVFKTKVDVGGDFPVSQLKKEFDAICLTGGSREPRDLKIEGRDLKGIHFAMDYLMQMNGILNGAKVPRDKLIDAKGKKVVVIGGGDTGADCVGVAHRQGAACVEQIELLSRPPECRAEKDPWPKYPLLLKTSTSHEEGGKRHWEILTKSFIGKKGAVKKIACVRIEFDKKGAGSCSVMKEIPGSEFKIDADLVILAIGFIHPEHGRLLKELKLEFDPRGNVKTDPTYMTSVKGVFSAGDMRRGQSLIVHAIAEGRRTAHFIDKYLMKKTNLPLM